MDNVHSVHGQYPLRPWRLSTESMDNVQSVHRLFPWVFPILYLVKNYSNPSKLNTYIQFTMHHIISYQSLNLGGRRGTVDDVHNACHLYFMTYNAYMSINNGGARWLSGRVSDSGARGPGFETYRRRVVSLSKTLYSPKVLVNYPGSDGSIPT